MHCFRSLCLKRFLHHRCTICSKTTYGITTTTTNIMLNVTRVATSNAICSLATFTVCMTLSFISDKISLGHSQSDLSKCYRKRCVIEMFILPLNTFSHWFYLKKERTLSSKAVSTQKLLSFKSSSSKQCSRIQRLNH